MKRPHRNRPLFRLLRSQRRDWDQRELRFTPDLATQVPREQVGQIPLGDCCVCGIEPATAVVLIPRKGTVPGHGWGCTVCGLPADGACVVLCDGCTELWRTGDVNPSIACRGYPAVDGRIPILDLSEPHHHDMSKHRD